MWWSKVPTERLVAEKKTIAYESRAFECLYLLLVSIYHMKVFDKNVRNLNEFFLEF